ncbi:ABC transporter substrate-binding protein [Corynebacterium epidermidicanis]|uniref:ABC-type sugar transport system, periplasmic component n=1 Tax=Corynebacterium epidermidicanis TaxID=1050174 RepID=A0A0G3GWE8_9CORY|nr:ABC transporter substrate-binding protein [Corynebacterium epidermidicanis]AKK03147.1 ABC-type sugar transport system, periplasmic component [Corynebacterium epidermidicanis]
MKSIKRISAVLAAAAIAASGLVACSSGGGDSDKGSVYFLNFKPEQDAAYQKIAKDYTAKTGVQVKVVTAASNSYEQTLKAEIGKKDAPTIFQVNGPTGLKTWQPYMADMTDAQITKNLNPDVPALKGSDGKVYGVPFAVEGYGLIYNAAIFDKYFALPDAKAKSAADVKDYATLKAVSEDMQAKKAELGIEGVFASTSLASGEDWRWQTHLANLPVHQEFKDLGTKETKDLKFKYNEDFKNIFDLYLNNSTVDKKLAPSKAVTDSMAEFALGKAAMVQNGNWAWSQIDKVNGNVVKPENVKYLPIYMGLPDEQKTGIAVGTENYLGVNAKAPEANRKASVDFINWLFTTDEGKKYVINDLGFNAPFNNFSKTDTPNDPLAKEVAAAIDNKDLTTIPWDFQYFPSQKFKNDFGQALAQYAAGKMPWDEVVKVFVDGWAAESAGK